LRFFSAPQIGAIDQLETRGEIEPVEFAAPLGEANFGRTGVRRLDLSISVPAAATANQSSVASFDLKFSVVNAR